MKIIILNDIYQEGEKLPSLRQLSKNYQVSLDTIKKLSLYLKRNISFIQKIVVVFTCYKRRKLSLKTH
ncbi:GntR family transcriptional regulator [Vagococcus fluvialis]|nr:GntR family transcriptional regulator [Vagococcus fluvialis]